MPHSLPVRAAGSALLLSVAIAAQTVQEYPIPRPGAFPHDPAFTADGIVWYTDQNNSTIGRLDPDTGVIVDYPTPTPNSGPHGITVSPDGFVWYTGQDAGRIGRLDPANGQITEFVMPANANRPHTPIAHQGAIWFTAQNNATYGRLDPANGNTQVWNVPAGSRPYGIFAAPDGALWIALFGTNALARVDPTTGADQLFPLPNSSARPRRLTVSNDGFVWYTDYQRNYLGRLDPATGQVREWPTLGSRPYGIALGTDGRVWFHSQSNRMVAFDPRTEQMQSITIPTAGSTVRHMVCDYARGRLWLALSGTQRIGRIRFDVPVTFFGQACAGAAGTPTFAIGGDPRVGERLTFTVGNTSAPLAALALGFSDKSWSGLPLPFDLLVIGAGGCLVNSSWEIVRSASSGSFDLVLPLDPSLNQALLFAQWALLGDPSGLFVVTTSSARMRLIGL